MTTTDEREAAAIRRHIVADGDGTFAVIEGVVVAEDVTFEQAEHLRLAPKQEGTTHDGS
jgi:hypothetical protein